MLWVVIGHSPLSVPNLSSAFDTDYHECAMFLKKIAYSFHMPLFIMISGYLFYITRINKGSQYKKTLSDKFVRLGIPYVFFTVFAFFLKVYAGGVQRPVALSLKSFLCFCMAVRWAVAGNVVCCGYPDLLFLIGNV